MLHAISVNKGTTHLLLGMIILAFIFIILDDIQWRFVPVPAATEQLEQS